ncbi:MAG: permease-like cell division protein FtsX [bacterium]
MFWVNVKRIVRAGSVSFWRNKFVSLSAVLAMTLALFVIGGTIFLSEVFNATTSAIKDRVDVNVYFITDAEEADVLAVQKDLQGLPEVKEVTYTSRVQALDNFKARYKDNTLVMQSLTELGQNPLGASLSVKAKDPSQYEAISNYLKSNGVLSKDKTSIVDKINYFENKDAIDRLTKLSDWANNFILWLVIALVAVAIIVTLNTVRLVIHISREEISVMRLVGASNKYVNGPFIISGIIYGFVSSVIVLAILFPLSYWLGQFSSFFSGLNLFTFYMSDFLRIALIVVGAGLIIGTFSSILAVQRYLKH